MPQILKSLYSETLTTEYKPSLKVALPIAMLYSELHDLSASDDQRQRYEGSFSVKRIGGRRYWYHQVWCGRKRLQKALGPETPELLERIKIWREQAQEWRIENSRRRQMVRSLKAGLRMTTDPLSGRVITRLSELGVFAGGALLIGTHAYMTYGPMLGVRFAQANLRTGDIDIGAVDVATKDISVSFADAVRSVDDHFFIVPPRPGSTISTSLRYKGGEIRVELLTPLQAGNAWEPHVIRSLRFGAQKTPFLDYLIENPVEATYLFDEGVRVRVPHPARFAWHKLIVAANRDLGSRTKALKDIAQSSELFKILLEDSPSQVQDAARHLGVYGDEHVAKAREGALMLNDALKEKVQQYLRED